MTNTSKLLLIFIPALLLLGLGLFIRITQYEPLIPSAKTLAEQNAFKLPILPTDPILGEKKAPKTIIAFEDFACEHCQFQQELLSEVREKHPNDVKIVFKGLPVATFPFDSRIAHAYAFCAEQQGEFELFASYAFTNGSNLSESVLNTIVEQIEGLDAQIMERCIESYLPEQHISTTEQIAATVQLQTVPTFFVNNKQIQNPQTVEEWENILGL